METNADDRMATGYQALTDKKGVIETVSLARERSDWKVVGIYLD